MSTERLEQIRISWSKVQMGKLVVDDAAEEINEADLEGAVMSEEL